MYEPTMEIMKLCAKPECWFAPSDKPDDWERWGSTFSKNRDSNILDISNYETITDDMLERFPDDTTIIPSSHWLCGWIDQLWVRHFDNQGPTKAHEAIMEWKDKLDSYPVADEGDFCQREYDNQIEYLTSYGSMTENQAKEVYTWLYDNDIEWYDDNTWVDDKYVDEAKDALFINVLDDTEIDIAEWIKKFIKYAINDMYQMRFI